MAACKHFGCLPSQLYAEDASFVRLFELVELGKVVDDGE